jgi:hypothetical protein
LHVLGIKAAALNHEIVDHAVEDGAVVVLVLDVLQKVLNGLGALSGYTSITKSPAVVVNLTRGASAPMAGAGKNQKVALASSARRVAAIL